MESPGGWLVLALGTGLYIALGAGFLAGVGLGTVLYTGLYVALEAGFLAGIGLGTVCLGGDGLFAFLFLPSIGTGLLEVAACVVCMDHALFT